MKLSIVATPIGNLGDVSRRAIETLQSADIIFCEDTRVAQKLLSAYGIKKNLESVHQHTTPFALKRLFEKATKTAKNIAFVSDAGTPGISDPGGILVQEALKYFGSDITIEPIPGPSAVTAALSVCGFQADRYRFLGFIPHKKGRETFFKNLAQIDETVVFYESTHRIVKTMDSLCKVLGNRRLMVARELTKMHETLYRGNACEVSESLKSGIIKGEFVIVIAPKKYEE
ncbi:MAG: Methyltransferase [uncultured bacterium]|nr:MAG: Methyltransferase [uncultured bacterium]